MRIHSLLILALLYFSSTALADDRYILRFELPIADEKTEKGMIIVSPKPFTWSHGLQRSYLSLKCEKLESGQIQKQYIPEEHFTGLMIEHKLVDHNIELAVTYSTGIPRLKEIRALAPDECKEISPSINRTQQSYRIPATHGLTKTLAFGKNMKLHIKLQSMGRGKL